MNIDIVALQEPPINTFTHTVASRDWISVYPSTHAKNPEKTRTVTLIHADLSTDSWNQLNFPSRDVTVIQVMETWGTLTIFNIYNNSKHNDTINLL
ncbi:hypothetical protein BC827DRAFT_1122472, partial [Russula dissimulans]